MGSGTHKGKPARYSGHAPVNKAVPRKEEGGKGFSDILGIFIIIILGFIIYSNSFTCSFQFDDFGNIVDNPMIKKLSDLKSIWNSYPNRPVPEFTFALNYHFNKLDVRYWHLVNLAIHLVTSCLVMWLSLLIFSTPVLKDEKTLKHKRILALIIALLFLSHPLATQSVTYIVQRMASMVAMFYILSVALYIKARITDKRFLKKILLFAGSFIAGILAILSKENALTLPIAILLAEFFFIRSKNFTINLKGYGVILAILAGLGIILILMVNSSLSIFNDIPPTKGHNYTLTPWNYLLTQFSVIVKYIQLLIIPVNQQVDYNFPVSDNFFGFRTLLSFLLILGSILLAIYLYNRNRIISFGIIWFFLTLMVESSIIPIADVIFEHRTYLPSFGFFLALTAGIYFLFGERRKYWGFALLFLVIAINSVLTYERNKVWQNEFTLWSDNVEKAPDCARALTNLGLAYGNMEQWEKAIACYSKAVSVSPGYSNAWYNRGYAYGALRQWDRAIADYTRAVAIDTAFTDAFFNRGFARGALQQWDSAIADYTRTVKIAPDYASAYFNRGHAFGSMQRWDSAIADYSRTIMINPQFANAYFNRGTAYSTTRDWDKAIKDFSTAIELDPSYKESYVNRGVTYENKGEWDKAVEDFTMALRIDPGFTVASQNREKAINILKAGKGH